MSTNIIHSLIFDHFASHEHHIHMYIGIHTHTHTHAFFSFSFPFSSHDHYHHRNNFHILIRFMPTVTVHIAIFIKCGVFSQRFYVYLWEHVSACALCICANTKDKQWHTHARTHINQFQYERSILTWCVLVTHISFFG